MNMIAPQVTTPDYQAIKVKQNGAWASGDYAKIGVTLQIVGEDFGEAMDLPVDSTVLDVAAGNGNATLAFARRWCKVTSTDYVDTLLARGRERAEAEGLDVAFEVVDAENLPYDDDSFDAVVSTFGCMFTPNQDKTASELARVCRAGGRIGMADWTQDGFIGKLFKALGKHVPPPTVLSSPARWGNEDWISGTFGDAIGSLSITRKDFIYRYRSPDHFVDFFRTFYGPVHKTILALEPAQHEALDADILATVAAFNTATDGSMRVTSEYAEIVIIKA